MSKKKLEAKMVFAGPDAESGTLRRETKVGRNDPCPCGSGKKAKNCCGVTAVYKYNKFRFKVTREDDMKKQTRPFSGIVLQRNPVTNRRASHSFITGASRNNHAVEPCFWLLFVDKTRF